MKCVNCGFGVLTWEEAEKIEEKSYVDNSSIFIQNLKNLVIYIDFKIIKNKEKTIISSESYENFQYLNKKPIIIKMREFIPGLGINPDGIEVDAIFEANLMYSSNKYGGKFDGGDYIILKINSSSIEMSKAIYKMLSLKCNKEFNKYMHTKIENFLRKEGFLNEKKDAQ